jgi:radical SAM protein with 4Fe4S-binding SPASM domain
MLSFQRADSIIFGGESIENKNSLITETKITFLVSKMTNITLDDLDRNILEILQQDGRISFADLSRKLNIAEATIRFRIKREVFGCGFLPIPAGNVRQQKFSEIYQKAPLFVKLRDNSLLTGKCGRCDFQSACGGCRARALSVHKNVMAEEPYCTYNPVSKLKKS